MTNGTSIQDAAAVARSWFQEYYGSYWPPDAAPRWVCKLYGEYPNEHDETTEYMLVDALDALSAAEDSDRAEELLSWPLEDRELALWLASSADRIRYVNECRAELGPQADVMEDIRCGYQKEQREILSYVRTELEKYLDGGEAWTRQRI